MTRLWLGRAILLLCLTVLALPVSGCAQQGDSGGIPGRSSEADVNRRARLLPPPTPEEARAPDPALAAGKRAYRFDEWPGKNGRVRPGINVGKVLGERMPGIKFGFHGAPRAEAVDLVWYRTEKPRCDIRVWVCESPEKAHEMLIKRLVHRTNAAIDTRGAELGVSLGDLSFPGEANTKFVRNNINFEVRSDAGDSLEIAHLLDQAVLARPAFDSYDDFAPFCPQIRELRIPNRPTPLSVDAPSSSTSNPMSFVVDVVNPEGGRLFLSWEQSRHLRVEPLDSGDYRIWVSFRWATNGWEEERVTLVALNEWGLLSRADFPARFRLREQ